METIREEKMNIDKVLNELGNFGYYQLYVLILTCLPNLFGSMYSVSYVFTTDDIQYRCVIPECESNSSLYYNDTWVQYSSPNGSNCTRYEFIATSEGVCTESTFDQETVLDCDEWLYASDDTITAEFDLACEDYKRTLVGSIRSIGLVIALVIGAYISDNFGRKPAFCIISLFAAVFGIAKSLSVNYIMYICMEFFEAVLGYGFVTCAFLLVLEIAKPSLRVLYTSMTGISFGTGGVLLGMIAWKVPYWRHLLLFIYTPSLLFFLYIYIADESPRWLYSKGKREKAAKIIRKAAKWNGVKLTKRSEEFLDHDIKDEPHSLKQNKEKKSIVIQILTSKKVLLRVSLCSYTWIASNLIYYGLTISSVSLGGNKYINFSLSALAEVAASLLIMMSLERYGRRKCISTAFILCGVCCIVPLIDDNYSLLVVLFFIGKMAITYAFNSLYLYTSEIFPTQARNSLLATCSLIGRIGSILAPQTPLLNIYSKLLVPLIFSSTAILAAVFILIIPETQNKRLPDTVIEAENVERLEAESNITFVTSL